MPQLACVELLLMNGAELHFVLSDELTVAFRRFGPLVVDWPHKAESKSYFPPKGILVTLSSVNSFIINNISVIYILIYTYILAYKSKNLGQISAGKTRGLTYVRVSIVVNFYQGCLCKST